MSRSLTTDLKNQTLAATLTPVLFAYFAFQSGDVRVWSGFGSKSWDGHTWQGLGQFGTVSPIEESRDTRANGASFQLTGVPSSLIATVLGDNYSRRPVKLWLGTLDASDAIIADPYLIFSGRMNNVEIDPGPETSTIRVMAESRLIDLKRSRERRYTHEDQQIDYPGDLFFDRMATAQSTPFLWGGKPFPGQATTPRTATYRGTPIQIQ